jgi:hypothetical protein
VPTHLVVGLTSTASSSLYFAGTTSLAPPNFRAVFPIFTPPGSDSAPSAVFFHHLLSARVVGSIDMVVTGRCGILDRDCSFMSEILSTAYNFEYSSEGQQWGVVCEE